jgi:hypothetical protein
MRHPTEGVLRRLLDEPAGVADADRQHVADCPLCLVSLAQAREDATAVDAAMRVDSAQHVDSAAAWDRLSAALPGHGPVRAAATRTRSRGSLVRRPAIAALAFVVVLTGAGVAAANDWLQIFRTEQITPVSVSTADLVALPDLTAYGDVEVTGGGEPNEVADAAAAHSATGLDVPEVVTLPRGVSGQPTYQVVGELSAVFTFSAAKAAQSADAGEPAPPVPAGLDGSQVRLVAGPAVAEVWSQSGTGVPTLVVGRAVAPTAFSSGAPFETLRDYLLSLPGLPKDLAAQLRTFSADGSTLPLPVPADLVSTSSADVHGRPATVFTSRDQTMAAVVWVDHGVVTAVAGALSGDELLTVARELL